MGKENLKEEEQREEDRAAEENSTENQTVEVRMAEERTEEEQTVEVQVAEGVLPGGEKGGTSKRETKSRAAVIGSTLADSKPVKSKRRRFSWKVFIPLFLLLSIFALLAYICVSPVEKTSNIIENSDYSFGSDIGASDVADGLVISEGVLEWAFIKDFGSFNPEWKYKPYLELKDIYFDSEFAELTMNIKAHEGFWLPVNTSINVNYSVKREAGGKISISPKSYSLGRLRLPLPAFIAESIVPRSSLSKYYRILGFVDIEDAAFNREGLKIKASLNSQKMREFGAFIKKAFDEDLMKKAQKYGYCEDANLKKTIDSLSELLKKDKLNAAETALNFFNGNFDAVDVYALLKKSKQDDFKRLAEHIYDPDTFDEKVGVKPSSDEKFDKLKQFVDKKEEEEGKKKAAEDIETLMKFVISKYETGLAKGAWVALDGYPLIDLSTKEELAGEFAKELGSDYSDYKLELISQKGERPIIRIDSKILGISLFDMDGNSLPPGSINDLGTYENLSEKLEREVLEPENKAAYGGAEYTSIVDSLKLKDYEISGIRRINVTGNKAYVEAYAAPEAYISYLKPGPVLFHCFFTKIGEKWKLDISESSSDFAAFLERGGLTEKGFDFSIVLNGSRPYAGRMVEKNPVILNPNSSGVSEISTHVDSVSDGYKLTSYDIDIGSENSISFKFDKVTAIKSIDILNGNQLSEEEYRKGLRIKKLKLSLDDGSVFSFTLDDEYGNYNTVSKYDEDKKSLHDLKSKIFKLEIEEFYGERTEDNKTLKLAEIVFNE